MFVRKRCRLKRPGSFQCIGIRGLGADALTERAHARHFVHGRVDVHVLPLSANVRGFSPPPVIAPRYPPSLGFPRFHPRSCNTGCNSPAFLDFLPRQGIRISPFVRAETETEISSSWTGEGNTSKQRDANGGTRQAGRSPSTLFVLTSWL